MDYAKGVKAMGYLEITKDMVFPLLIKKRKVYAVVFKSKHFHERLYDLQEWNVGNINRLLGEENVKYFIEESK